MWEQQMAINREVLRGNATHTAKIFNALWKNVEINSGGDGVQADGSFHFHGHILYSGGYGGDYALQITTLAKLASDTSFQPPQATLKVYNTYILDGQQVLLCASWCWFVPSRYSR